MTLSAGDPPPSTTPVVGRSPYGLLQLLLEKWRATVLFPLLLAAGALVLSPLLPRVYTAYVSFVPESRSTPALPAALGGLAGQLGFSFSTDASESPQFYVNLARSRTLLDAVLLDSFPSPDSNGDSARALLDIFDIEGDSRALRLERGRRHLQKILSATVDRQTSTVTLSVRTSSPELSAEVANRIVSKINEFNLQQRQSQARERLRFVERRVAEADSALRAAEGQLQGFLERNALWQSSPELRFQHDRLQRSVTLRQEVLVTLNRELEMARIETVNDTPVITIIDAAVPPVRRSRPRPLRNSITALVIGGILGIFGALATRYRDVTARTHADEYEALRHTWRRLRSRLVR